MELRDAIYGRRAVRAFTGRTPDDATIGELIDAAIHAPSAMNDQPWSFTVVRDRAKLRTISAASKRHLARASLAGLDLDRLRPMIEDESLDIFHGAPALIVISGPVDNAWATIDCALAAENFMLAAHARGLGTCWIGLAQGWLSSAEGRTEIGLPEGQAAIAPIILGEPVAQAGPAPRRPAQIRWIG